MKKLWKGALQPPLWLTAKLLKFEDFSCGAGNACQKRPSCAGAKSEDQSVLGVKTLVEILKKGGIKIRNELNITIQNVVASANLGGRVRLEPDDSVPCRGALHR